MLILNYNVTMGRFLWVYSLVQGITEAIPVSSSSHIRLIAQWMQFPLSLALESALHMGTGLAFCAVYPSSVGKMFLGFFHILRGHFTTKEARWWMFVAISSLPVLIVGGILHVLHIRLQSPNIIAFLCVLFGFLLWWSDQYGARLYPVKIEKFEKGWAYRALTLGFLQMLALLPGVSRLGACLLASRWIGYSRIESLRISISLGIVSIFACVTLEAQTWRTLGLSSFLWGQTIAITFTSCVVTLLIFRYYIERFSFLWFFFYRCILAIFLLCYSAVF
ncbi:undecaprenyl-diphosphatase [Holospora obtusa F1]|uniref:Undecaprenyl-diphosphatase n=1 Tax=Holospora obtusa F1 TaxID=1399147 RepID=W6TED4_HOLOB|nr:undecaprenyl-diphosphate phosphatase [Holospora obtusa]ETZ07558.1 undecaprenyl-diphosphatase [Holospora obtusa F1]